MAMRRSVFLSLFLSVLAGAASAADVALVGAGYREPTRILVAPGQITTLFFAGLESVLLEPAVATAAPWPTELAGISLVLEQSGREPSPVPLLSVSQRNICAGASTVFGNSPDCLAAAVVVQIPFELQPPPEVLEAALVLEENGVRSRSFRVLAVSSNLHVPNWCDDFPQRTNRPCGGVVAHSDGTPVDADAPARPGETVVVYAYGLGRTDPPVPSGSVAPSAMHAVAETVVAQLDFRPNPTPSSPYRDPQFPDAYPIIEPSFVGLTPGLVGVYQINVPLPAEFPDVPLCSFERGVAWNASINVSSSSEPIGLSVGGAPICVAP